MRVYKLVVALVVVSWHCQAIRAGVLGDFQKDATKDRSHDRRHDHYRDDHYHQPTYYGNGRRRPRRSGASPFASIWEKDPHEPGDPILPFARFDGRQQSVETNVDARDYYVQIGYEPFALDVRHTRFTETNPTDHLDVYRFHALFRLGGASETGLFREGARSFYEIDFGLGYVQLDGVNRQGAVSFTLPILIYPSKHLGFEFRPAWATINESKLADYDLSAHVLLKYVGVKAGYRWLKSPTMELSGPYLGLTMRF